MYYEGGTAEGVGDTASLYEELDGAYAATSRR